MNDNTKSWIKKAEEDKITCELLLKSEFYPKAVVCFHSQQLAEKMIKAYLTEKGTEFTRTHDLMYLLSAYLIPADKSMEKLSEACEYLTDFGVLPRYPGDFPDLSDNEARAAFNFALEIKEFIEKNI
ncbi:MAG: HEPN domain-containing protein [Bacteroidales bacterium]|nr:HEPN domain-containing protein [Bacteroidales bacterium]